MPSWPLRRPSVSALPEAALRPAADTAAVVVAFNPPAGFEQRLLGILEQCAIIVLVDNASTRPAPHQGLPTQRVQLLRNAENRGIAAALNQGVRHAAQQGYRCALLLDHDSMPEPGAVIALQAALMDDPLAVAAVPQILYGLPDIRCRWPQTAPGRHFRFRFLYAAQLGKPQPVDLAISSGMLIDISVFEQLGGFDESLFIDLVDTEFCLFARRQGRHILAAPSARLRHELGSPTRRHLPGGLPVFPTHHSAMRHYYISRNRIVLSRRYGLRFPSWLAYEWLSAAKLLIKVLLFESERLRKLAAMLRGTGAGLRLAWRDRGRRA